MAYTRLESGIGFFGRVILFGVDSLIIRRQTSLFSDYSRKGYSWKMASTQPFGRISVSSGRRYILDRMRLLSVWMMIAASE